jgi:RNA polymerase sigma factor (sigma-70 family)
VSAVGGVTSENRGGERAADRRAAAERLIGSHDAVFRRTARRYSICADDAEDAYQRSLEILLTKAPLIDGDALVRWMQTVTKREALAVRRQRERLLSAPRPSHAGEDDDRDPLDAIASDRAGPSDRAASRERVARSGEALRALKPQELRALTLKAQGYSYSEIGEITGWTYTKINRCMAEGRKRFLEVFAELEQGRRCGELSSALSALADGEAAVDGAEEVERHLRACGPCRAKLRAFRAIPDRVLELLPAGPAIDHSAAAGASQWIGDRVGYAAEKVREAGYALAGRGAAEGGAPLAAGGTRGAGLAALGKLLAVCGATAAGGAACVATGVVDTGAAGLGKPAERPPVERPVRPAETPVLEEQAPPAAPRPVPDAPVEADPAPAPEPKPAQQVERQFGIETGSAAPAGGGEFGGPAGGGGSSPAAGRGGFGFEKG